MSCLWLHVDLALQVSCPTRLERPQQAPCDHLDRGLMAPRALLKAIPVGLVESALTTNLGSADAAGEESVVK